MVRIRVGVDLGPECVHNGFQFRGGTGLYADLQLRLGLGLALRLGLGLGLRLRLGLRLVLGSVLGSVFGVGTSLETSYLFMLIEG